MFNISIHGVLNIKNSFLDLRVGVTCWHNIVVLYINPSIKDPKDIPSIIIDFFNFEEYSQKRREVPVFVPIAIDNHSPVIVHAVIL